MSKEYDEYIIEHRNAVGECLKLLAQEPTPVKNLSDTLISQIVSKHDVSKNSVEEYQAYDDWFYGDKGSEDRLSKQTAFNKAWLHHIHSNPHHWQHWILFEDDPSGECFTAIEMPVLAVIEMVADWGSFAYRKKNSLELLKWYEDHKGKMRLHADTQRLVDILIENLCMKLKQTFGH